MVGESDDQTRPIHPVPPAKQDPMGIGEVSWPKVVLILGVTLILCVTLIIGLAFLALPSDFWMVKP
jgi:hypothetical protein